MSQYIGTAADAIASTLEISLRTAVVYGRLASSLAKLRSPPIASGEYEYLTSLVGVYRYSSTWNTQR